MHGVVLGEREAGLHVLADEGGLVGLQVLDEGVVDGLLEGGTISRHGLLLVFVEYVSALGLGGLVLEGGVSHLGDVSAVRGHLSARRDRVHLVHALERNAVHLEGSIDEEETRLELLEEDDSLSAESAGGEDENAACFDAFAQLGGVSFLSAGSTLAVLSGVPIECFDH